jgi:uncharacterized protein (DUF2236 family)
MGISFSPSTVVTKPVSREQSEALLGAMEHNCADSRVGIFGPGSVSWRVHRESALFLAAGRALMLQLAHPWVATAIAEHSHVMDRPIARFHNTFRVVYAMVFGSLDQALGASRHLYALHSRIEGEMTEDVAAYPRESHYQANEIAALRWVYATLIDSAVMAYEWVLPPLGDAEREAYYAESRTLASLFGLPVTELPSDWKAFVSYCRAMEESQSLGVSGAAREMAQRLLAGAGSWIKPPRWYRTLTAISLSERLRGEFGMTVTQGDWDSIDRVRRWLPKVYRALPSAVRFVGPWHEACARLDGREVGMVARVSNRFWIGEVRMPFANHVTLAMRGK